MGQQASQILEAESDTIENNAEIEDEIVSNGNHEVEDEATHWEEGSAQPANSKSIKRGRKQKSLASLAGVNVKLSKKESKHIGKRISVPKDTKNSPKSARGVGILRASQGGPGIQSESSSLAEGTKGDELTVESKGNVPESPHTIAGLETTPGSKSHPHGTPKKSRKRGGRSRKSAAMKLEVLEGQELASNPHSSAEARHAMLRVNQSGSLHPSTKEVEDVNLKSASNLKEPLNLLEFNNGTETVLHVTENHPIAQILIPDAGRGTETQTTSDEDMTTSHQPVSGAKIGADQDTPMIEQAQQDTPIENRRKRKRANHRQPVDTLKKKKRKYNSDESDINMLGEGFSEDPPSLSSQMVIRPSPSVPLAPNNGLSDLRAMKRTVSPPFKVVIPVPSDPASLDPSVSTRPKRSKKRKMEVRGASSITANVYSDHSHFLLNNPSHARPLKEPQTSPMQSKPSSLIDTGHESELELHITQNGYYNYDETRRAEKKRKLQPELSDEDTGEQPSSSISNKFSRSAFKPKSLNDSNDHQFRQKFARGRATPVSRQKKPGATEPTATGKFSEEEIAIIDNEMLKHREMHDMTSFDQNQLVQDNARGAPELFDEICKSLPSRTRSSVIKTCRRRYHNFEARGKWTEEDDEALRAAHTQHPNRWKEISKAINRHPEDARDRWRNYLICGGNLKRAQWTEEEEENLREVVEECLENVRHIRRAAMQSGSQGGMQPDIDLVDWQTVSSKLGRTRSRLQCISKWKQLQEREDPHNEKTKDAEIRDDTWRAESAKKIYCSMERVDKYDLLLAIKDSRAGTEGKVPWIKLGDVRFQQKWPCMVRKLAWKRLRAKVPGNKDMKFQDIVYKLIDSFREVLVDDLSDIDTITPTPRYRSGPRQPPLSKKFVHSDTDEDLFEKRRSRQARTQKREGGLEKMVNGTNKPKEKNIRDRMAKAEECLKQSGVELSVEVDHRKDIEHEDEANGREGAHHEGETDHEGIEDFGFVISKRSLTQDMVRNAVNELYEEDKPTDHGDDDCSDEKDEAESSEALTSNSQYNNRQSIDLEGASYRGGTPSQLESRSPRAPPNNETQVGDYDDDGDDDGDDDDSDDDHSEDDDIPARRPIMPNRLQSIEL